MILEAALLQRCDVPAASAVTVPRLSSARSGETDTPTLHGTAIECLSVGVASGGSMGRHLFQSRRVFGISPPRCPAPFRRERHEACVLNRELPGTPGSPGSVGSMRRSPTKKHRKPQKSSPTTVGHHRSVKLPAPLVSTCQTWT